MKVYTSEPQQAPKRRVKVGIADYAVGSEESTLLTSGLGSCVGIALRDRRSGVIGLAHAMLPENEGTSNRGKYVDSAIDGLLEEMVDAGAGRSDVVAKLAGGSEMFEFTAGDGSIGKRNAIAARKVLDARGIRVVAEDVGGSHGRSLEFDGSTGDLTVKSAARGTSTL